MTPRESAPARRLSALHAGGAALLLAAFALLLHWRLLFGGRVLADGDLLLYFLPYRDYAAEALRAGRLPFWNPYLFAGAPFLANPQAAVLYPLHWPLSWLAADRQIYWSAALHVWLLGLGGFALARRLGAGWVAALTAGLVLQGSGFVGGMIGHLNQLNGVAWLPWALLVLTPRRARWEAGDGLRGVLWLAPLVALMLLAGHTQTTYINLVGAGLWASAGAWAIWRAVEGSRGARLWQAATPLWVLAGGALLGALLSMPQLLPTLELSGRGLRQGGLSFAEASSFSLPPLKLLWSLLPTYGLVSLEARFGTPAWSEFLAWVGFVALGAAAGGVWQWRRARRGGLSVPGLHLVPGGLLLAAVGFLLALGRWNPLTWLLWAGVPGFNLFRTPARWMILYTLGMALLAAAGVVALQRRTRWAATLPLLVAAELLVASLALPSAHPTAPFALDSMRTAPAHLLTAPDRLAAVEAGMDPARAGRFLGMSTITYDPGDMADLQRLFRDPGAPQLSAPAFERLIIALKVRELLAPNLPLLQRVPALDGYDGGVIPVERYNQIISLLAPADTLTPDGRLREQIREVPPAALLGLFDVRHVVTDKVQDLWFEGLFYDRQIGARLEAGEPPLRVDAGAPFPATHVDLIAWVEPGDAAILAGSIRTVGALVVDGPAARSEFRLTAGALPGAHMADDALDSPHAAAAGAVVALRDVEAGRLEYRIRLPLPEPMAPTALWLEATDPSLPLVVKAATLLDARSGMFQALLPSDRGAFHLTHSGDVKVYEALEGGARASLLADVQTAANSAEALELLRALDPTTQAVVEAPLPADFPGAEVAARGQVTITAYAPEKIDIVTRSERPALLLLRDAWDPGWSATVNGEATALFPADVHFRGLFVPAGDATVRLTYRPPGWRLGLVMAGGGALLWLAAAFWAVSRRATRTAERTPTASAL